jgi:type IV pilus assembly protein PilB
MVVFGDAEQERHIGFLKKREEEELAQMLSRKYGVEYVDLSLVSINTDALRIIPEAQARSAEAVVFGIVDKKLSVAVRAPESSRVLTMIKELEERGYSVTLFMASQESLERGYSRYADFSFATESKAGVFEISPEEIESLVAKVKGLPDITSLIQETFDIKKTYRVTRIVEVILAGGLATNASDIHFEPEEKNVRLRYRLDGVLVDVLAFDTETYRLMLSRMKLISGMKLNITDQAQDGRFSIVIKGDDIELRASILPGNYGETMVLRILNPNAISVSLSQLGFEPKLLARIEREIARPTGMILTTGPTGSGKTTTLYAFLRSINVPGTKIITIEDPVEYHLAGIVQTQVDKKEYTFNKGLREVLRADPDVIMVGEIRDDEVATTAINAALTGHLVFSTLHTNNAAGTFPRLIDLGVSEKVLSSAINVAMAQRLVRKLCAACKQERALSPQEQAVINVHLATIVDRSLVPENTTRVWDASEHGCEQCGGRGYKGRIAVFEAVFMDSIIEQIMREKPSEREIAAAARPQGIPTMQEDGVIKILRGTTSLSEVSRVVDLERH